MRVLIFHGYLLRGTGSNVYTANLAQALARKGHEVHLLCQDRRAGELGWVGGRIRVHVPDIGGLLPVFVPDRHEGFEGENFPELTHEELDRHLEANIYAVRPHPERFVPYAREGTDAGVGILSGSSHTAHVLFETVPDPSLRQRTRL